MHHWWHIQDLVFKDVCVCVWERFRDHPVSIFRWLAYGIEATAVWRVKYLCSLTSVYCSGWRDGGTGPYRVWVLGLIVLEKWKVCSMMHCQFCIFINISTIIIIIIIIMVIVLYLYGIDCECMSRNVSQVIIYIAVLEKAVMSSSSKTIFVRNADNKSDIFWFIYIYCYIYDVYKFLRPWNLVHKNLKIA